MSGLQVTDSKERTLELRGLMSASSSGIAWDLRCLVREKLIAFLQRQPRGLPVLRAEASFLPDAAAPLANPLSAAKPGENVVVVPPGTRPG